ncbi:hypothetical protein, partial [Streptomyces sp. NPDC052107]|uniref:hypothetical protein n=1 Tax=Streptomyces sp. NPDC052107 TaxID=3155632 RepID=UPI0034156EA5
DLDHQGQGQMKITKWVRFDTPSEGQGSAVVEKWTTGRGSGPVGRRRRPPVIDLIRMRPDLKVRVQRSDRPQPMDGGYQLTSVSPPTALPVLPAL